MNKKYNIQFYKNRKIYFGISIAIMVIGIICNVIMGTSVDIQFAGGAMIKYSVAGGTVDGVEVQKIVKESLDRESTVTVNQGLLDDSDVQVTISFAGNEAISVDQQTALADTLTGKYENLTFSLEESSSVDPVMGASFLQKCLVCVLITFVLLLIYIGLRFRKIGGIMAGVTALLAILHDVIVIYFAFVIFRMPINDIFIAVVLTILGYSLNDTIVIYDRIRENREKMSKKTSSYADIIDLSLNQTMGRSIMTSVTTFLALLVISIVSIIYGMTTVTSFALPMMVGVISGCYSSIFIAAPLYAVWVMRDEKKAEKAK